jgi:hypothetical protein
MTQSALVKHTLRQGKASSIVLSQGTKTLQAKKTVLQTLLAGIAGPPGGGIATNVPIFDSRAFSVPCDSVTPAHTQAQAAIDAVSAAGGGILYFIGTDRTKRFYFDSSVWAKSNVVCVWVNEVLFGANGRMGILGALDESVQTRHLRSNVLVNDTVLHLQIGDGAGLAVGNVIALRGQNDATGVAIERQRVTILSIAGDDVTVHPPLEFEFDVTYPSSPAPTQPDKSTIKVLTASAIDPTTLAEGTPTIKVANAANFQINDVVIISDTMVCSDVVVGSSDNLIHIETNVVRSVDTVANTIDLQLPLTHTYNASFNPSVVRVLPAQNAGHVGLRIHWAAQSVDSGRHAMLLLFCQRCFVEKLRVIGDPATIVGNSLGSRGHGLRFSDGCIQNTADDVQVLRPAFWGAGEGYGATFYSGARANKLTRFLASGCRHSVLFFRGVTDNEVDGVISMDCRGTDVDFHGANERRNRVTNVRVMGGPSIASDINQKAAVKFGNPTHQVGPSDNVVDGVYLDAAAYFAGHFLPSSRNRLSNVYGTSQFGVYLQADSGAPTLQLKDTTLESIEFIGGTKHLQVDGGANKIVDGLRAHKIVARNATQQGPSFSIQNAGRVTVYDCENWAALSDGTVTSSYLVDAQNVTTLEVVNHRGDGAKRFISLLNCPGALVDRPVLSNQSERVVMYDAGGNDAMRLIDYETPYDAVFIDAVTPSPNIARVPRRRATARQLCALASPTSFAIGAQNVISGLSSNTAPLATEGNLLIQLNGFKPRIPKGLVTVKVKLPYVYVDATNEVVVVAFWRQNGGAWQVVPNGIETPRPTTGNQAGASGSLYGEIRHTLEDMSGTIDVLVNIGVNSATATLTVGGRFGGNDKPLLTLDEVVEL